MKCEINKEMKSIKENASFRVQFKDLEKQNLMQLVFYIKKFIYEPTNYLNFLIHRIKRFFNFIEKKIKSCKTRKNEKLIWETAQNLLDKIKQTKTESEEPLINDEFFEALIEEIKDQKCK